MTAPSTGRPSRAEEPNLSSSPLDTQESIQGSEYIAGAFQAACIRMRVRQSMGRVGSALDNAVIQSWHSTLEFELRSLVRFATKAEARAAIAGWIEDYNHNRRHSALSMLSPVQYELTLAATPEPLEAA